MDTDVEVLKNLDSYLTHNAFSGFESDGSIPTGIMASVAQNSWFQLQLDYYDGRHFISEDGKHDMTTNVETITKITKAHYSIELNNTFQDVGDIVFYPSDYFCPKSHKTGIISCTDNTACIHHFAGSWTSPAQQQFYAIKRKLITGFGTKIGTLFSLPAFCMWQIKDNGIRGFVKKICRKFFK